MSYDVRSYNPENHRLRIAVQHSLPGRDATTIETEVELHLCPNLVDREKRVSMLSIDLLWVNAATVPGMADELARILERVASGLREGPVGAMSLFGPEDE